MKNKLYFLVLVLILSSCSLQKEPVFIKVDNVRVLSFAADTIKLKAIAFLKIRMMLVGVFPQMK